MRRLALLAVLLAPALAGATGSSVYDAGPVAIPKSDYQVNPNIPSNEKISAADWNQLGQYTLDLQQSAVFAWYHGYAPLVAAPPPPDAGFRFFSLDGGVMAEYPDGGLVRFVLELGGMATVGSLDAGNVNAATLSVAGGLALIDNAGNVTHASSIFPDVTVQATAGYDTYCGAVSATASPQEIAVFVTRHAGTVKTCNWNGSYTGGATGVVTLGICDVTANPTCASMLGSWTQRCDGKFDDGGADATYQWGFHDFENALPNGHRILIGTSAGCSTRPTVNYCCQVSYP